MWKGRREGWSSSGMAREIGRDERGLKEGPSKQLV